MKVYCPPMICDESKGRERMYRTMNFMESCARTKKEFYGRTGLMIIMDSRSTFWFPTLDRELSVKRRGVEFVRNCVVGWTLLQPCVDGVARQPT